MKTWENKINIPRITAGRTYTCITIWTNFKSVPISREETEANKTAPAASPPKEPSTTTTSTQKPDPPPTVRTTTEQPREPEPREPEPRIEDNNVEPPPYNTIPNDPYARPTYEQPTTAEPEEQTHLIPTEDQQYITVTEPNYTPKQPEVTFNRPTPPSYIPEAELPRLPEEQPAATNPPKQEEQTNETTPPEEQQPETTYRPREQPIPFYQVNVNVDDESRTTTERRLKECPFGYEPDEYGACFGKFYQSITINILFRYLNDWLTDNAQPKLLVVEKGFLEIPPLGEKEWGHTGYELHVDKVAGES